MPYWWLTLNEEEVDLRIESIAQEVHVLRKCAHPNIVQYLGLCRFGICTFAQQIACPADHASFFRSYVYCSWLPDSEMDHREQMWIVMEYCERKCIFDLIREKSRA